MAAGNGTATAGGSRPRTRATALVLEAERDAGPEGPAAGAEALERLKAGAAETEAREVQAVAEGLTPENSVELRGKRFRIAAAIGIMPLMKFAATADAGMDTMDFRALAAMHAMLRDVIAGEVPSCGKCESCAEFEEQGGVPPNPQCQYFNAGDWARFEAHAIDTKVGAEELFPVVQQAIQVITARPTRQP